MYIHSHVIALMLLRCNLYRHCLDIQVMSGTTCWTDYKMVWMKLQLNFCCSPCALGQRPALLAVQLFIWSECLRIVNCSDFYSFAGISFHLLYQLGVSLSLRLCQLLKMLLGMAGDISLTDL